MFCIFACVKEYHFAAAQGNFLSFWLILQTVLIKTEAKHRILLRIRLDLTKDHKHTTNSKY